MRSNDRRFTVSLIWTATSPKDRLQLGVSVLLIIVGSMLEIISLGLIVPTVGSIISGDPRRQITHLPSWIQELSFSNFVYLLMSSLILAFVAKNIFLVISSYYQQRAQLALSNRLVQRLFEIYIKQPYEFHLTHSSSLLLRNVQEYASAVVSQGIAPALVLLGELLTSIGYVTVLLVIDPRSTTLLILTFGLITFATNRFSKRKTEVWGKQRLDQRARLADALLTGFGAIKEIKVFGREREFVASHRESLYAADRLVYRFGLLQSLPRSVFEVVTVAAVAILVMLRISAGENLESTAVIIALFGVVAFRLLPTVNRVTSTLQLLSFGRAGIVSTVEDFALNSGQDTAISRETVGKFETLRIEGLKYRYPNSKSFAVEIETLDIVAGESIGLIGPSGSGKSTLIDLLIGLLHPTTGRLVINDEARILASSDWTNQIGYVPQSIYLMDASIRRNVAFGLAESEINDERVRECLSIASLSDVVGELAEGMEARVGERGVRLSGGQRQRLGLARALYGSPQILVLDEATSALDEKTEYQIVEAIQGISERMTVIVVAHRMTTLRYCSRVLKMVNGRIVQDGSYSDVVGSL